jgi:hypothetical protein
MIYPTLLFVTAEGILSRVEIAGKEREIEPIFIGYQNADEALFIS